MVTLKETSENEVLKKKIRENFFTATEGHNAIIVLEKELNKKLEPVYTGVKQLTSDKNTYITPLEKAQIRREAERLISKTKHEYWEDVLETKHAMGKATLEDLVKSFERKAPFEVSIDEAEKLILQYNSRMATRRYLESIGLQSVVKSIGGKQIGGYTHSVFNDLTIEDVQTVVSGWKEGKDFQEIAKSLNNKSTFHPLNEKNIIAIMRGIVISGVPQEKNEAVWAVVNAVVNERDLSAGEREKYTLSELEYKGIRNSVEIMLARNTLTASLDFFQKNYPEIKLGEKSVPVGDEFKRIGPEYIKKILKDHDSVALAFKLENGKGAVKRFNLDEDRIPYMDADGRGREISSSGRMAAFAFLEPWEVEPFRMVVFEHMVPSSRKDVVVDGMKSEDGSKLWDKLGEREHLGLGDRDSFVVLVTSRQFASKTVDKFRERMHDVQERGGLALGDYVNMRLVSEGSVVAVKNDVHPFIQAEVGLTAMIAKARFEREKMKDDG